MKNKYFALIAIFLLLMVKGLGDDKLTSVYNEYMSAMSIEQKKSDPDFSTFHSDWYAKFTAIMSDPSAAKSSSYKLALDSVATLAYATKDYKKCLLWIEILLSNKSVLDSTPHLRVYFWTKAQVLQKLYENGEISQNEVVMAYEYVMSNHDYIYPANEYYITRWYEYLAYFLKDANPELAQKQSLDAINFIKNLNIDEYQRIYSETFRYTSIERFAGLFFDICSKQNQKDTAKALMESLLHDERSDHIVLLMKYSDSFNLSIKDKMTLCLSVLDLSSEPLWLRNISDYNEVAFSLYRAGYTADAAILANSVLKFLKDESRTNFNVQNFEDANHIISTLTLLLNTIKEGSK